MKRSKGIDWVNSIVFLVGGWFLVIVFDSVTVDLLGLACATIGGISLGMNIEERRQKKNVSKFNNKVAKSLIIEKRPSFFQRVGGLFGNKKGQ